MHQICTEAVLMADFTDRKSGGKSGHTRQTSASMAFSRSRGWCVGSRNALAGYAPIKASPSGALIENRVDGAQRRSTQGDSG